MSKLFFHYIRRGYGVRMALRLSRNRVREARP